jgi:hypothetical protein
MNQAQGTSSEKLQGKVDVSGSTAQLMGKNIDETRSSAFHDQPAGGVYLCSDMIFRDQPSPRGPVVEFYPVEFHSITSSDKASAIRRYWSERR